MEEQLLDENLKNENGESRKEVAKRMENVINRIISENLEKRIAIVSHGAAIKFFLIKYCNLNADHKLEYNGRTIETNSPGAIKIILEDKKVIEIKQII